MAIYITLDEQVKELEERYRFKTLLSVRDLMNIFGWSKTEAYRKIDEGIFSAFGEVPEGAKKIPKRIVVAYFRSLY